MKLDIPFYYQTEPFYCGIACLRMIVEYFGKEFREDELLKYCAMTELGTNCVSINFAAKRLGLNSEIRVSFTEQEVISTLNEGNPVIALIDPNLIYKRKNLDFKHFVVIIGYTPESFIIHDPEVGKNKLIKKEIFLKSWEVISNVGVVIWK